jgi:hypothetical protein
MHADWELMRERPVWALPLGKKRPGTEARPSPTGRYKAKRAKRLNPYNDELRCSLPIIKADSFESQHVRYAFFA